MSKTYQEEKRKMLISEGSPLPLRILRTQKPVTLLSLPAEIILVIAEEMYGETFESFLLSCWKVYKIVASAPRLLELHNRVRKWPAMVLQVGGHNSTSGDQQRGVTSSHPFKDEWVAPFLFFHPESWLAAFYTTPKLANYVELVEIHTSAPETCHQRYYDTNTVVDYYQNIWNFNQYGSELDIQRDELFAILDESVSRYLVPTLDVAKHLQERAELLEQDHEYIRFLKAPCFVPNSIFSSDSSDTHGPGKRNLPSKDIEVLLHTPNIRRLNFKYHTENQISEFIEIVRHNFGRGKKVPRMPLWQNLNHIDINASIFGPLLTDIEPLRLLPALRILRGYQFKTHDIEDDAVDLPIDPETCSITSLSIVDGKVKWKPLLKFLSPMRSLHCLDWRFNCVGHSDDTTYGVSEDCLFDGEKFFNVLAKIAGEQLGELTVVFEDARARPIELVPVPSLKAFTNLEVLNIETGLISSTFGNPGQIYEQGNQTAPTSACLIKILPRSIRKVRINADIDHPQKMMVIFEGLATGKAEHLPHLSEVKLSYCFHEESIVSDNPYYLTFKRKFDRVFGNLISELDDVGVRLELTSHLPYNALWEHY